MGKDQPPHYCHKGCGPAQCRVHAVPPGHHAQQCRPTLRGQYRHLSDSLHQILSSKFIELCPKVRGPQSIFWEWCSKAHRTQAPNDEDEK